MRHLVDAVDSERRFHKKPHGPLALYLKLKEAKWALAVETVLGPANLLAFCCHDQHDFQLLKRLMATHCNRGQVPIIIMQKFKVRNSRQSTVVFHVCNTMYYTITLP